MSVELIEEWQAGLRVEGVDSPATHSTAKMLRGLSEQDTVKLLDPPSGLSIWIWRVSVVAFVYGPSGLNMKKVSSFLSREDDLIAQLADYAEKTAQTEALIATCFNDRKGLIVSPTASPYIRGAGEECFEQYKAMIDTVAAAKSLG